LTLYVLYELVLLVSKLGFEKLVNVAIFLWEGVIIRGVIKSLKINVNSARLCLSFQKKIFFLFSGTSGGCRIKGTKIDVKCRN
jgi:hypothetical protein